jgi:hypothetical protein
MKRMKTFATFINSAKPGESVKKVKIAVIDDGINTTLEIFQRRIQTGDSFSELSAFAKYPYLHSSFYVPSGPHGTLMAQLICEVCPKVKLFVAKLEKVKGQDGGRSFTPESAIKVSCFISKPAYQRN